MDPVTHVLSASLFSEPLRRDAAVSRWRERAALGLGALLPDADGVIGWVDLSLYARYHRVVTHSLVGLVAVVLAAAALARWWPERWMMTSWRAALRGPRPTWSVLLMAASTGAVLHLIGDWITAWGLWPLWPFSDQDLALGRVNSLEPALLVLAVLGWSLQQRALRAGRRDLAWVVTACWLLAGALYVGVRPLLLGLPYA
jgi:inner membrane protein